VDGGVAIVLRDDADHLKAIEVLLL